MDNDPAREIVYPDGSPWCSRYTCGAVLLDREDPFRVIARTSKPLLVPEKDYETGNAALFWRENVIFPCGAILGGGSSGSIMVRGTIPPAWLKSVWMISGMK